MTSTWENEILVSERTSEMIEKALLTATMMILAVLGTQVIRTQVTTISNKIVTTARSAANPLTTLPCSPKTGTEPGCYTPTK